MMLAIKFPHIYSNEIIAEEICQLMPFYLNYFVMLMLQ